MTCLFHRNYFILTFTDTMLGIIETEDSKTEKTSLQHLNHPLRNALVHYNVCALQNAEADITHARCT